MEAKIGPPAGCGSLGVGCAGNCGTGCGWGMKFLGTCGGLIILLGEVSAELRIGEPVRVSDMTDGGGFKAVVVGRLLTGTGAVGISCIGIRPAVGTVCDGDGMP